MAGGFISKLRKKDSSFGNNDNGIISPEKAADMFAKGGMSGMLSSAEDKDLIDRYVI